MTTTSSDTAPDGCPVELYARLPAAGEPELIHAAVGAAPVSILELGCGTGRILRPLAVLGHEVTGVDESPAMLAHLGGLPAVCARIEAVSLARLFDVVLLASHLLNTPDDARRAAFLRTARRLVRPGGLVLAQLHPVEWFDDAGELHREVDGIGYHLYGVERDGPLLRATMEYRIAVRTWRHAFTTRRLTAAEVSAAFAGAGLRFERWIDDRHGWAAATTVP